MASTKFVSRIRHHSARIHISQSSDALAAVARNTGTKVPVKAFILLEDDIKVLCSTLNFMVAEAAGPILQLTRALTPGMELQIREDQMNVKPNQLKCELRDTEYRLMDPSTQYQLLAPFASFIGRSQRVTFTGTICDEAETAHLKRIMGPTTSCQFAHWYSVLEDISRLKGYVDDAAGKDDLNFVIVSYKRILEHIINLLTQEKLSQWVSNNCPRTAIELSTMCLRLTLNMACAQMKRKDFEGCEGDLEVFEAIVKMRDHYREDVGEPMSVVDDITLLAYHFNLTVLLYLYRDHKPGEQQTERTVKELAEELDGSACGPHQKHDRDVLRRFHDQDAIMSKECLPFDQCGAGIARTFHLSHQAHW
jgi:hypothetical protein